MMRRSAVDEHYGLDRRVVGGIFVGGRASRMGGIAKGLLEAPDGEPIVVRTKRVLERAGASSVLVGEHPAYARLGFETVADDSAATGPLAGLLALLAFSGERLAIAVACDMPLVDEGVVRRLVDTMRATAAPVVAPKQAVRGREVWEPLFAVYDAPRVLPVARAFAARGERKLQLLLDEAGARPFALSREEAEALADWDSPADLPAGSARGRRAT
jgi:molybdopterin-guanine dinucleotide biosynthesis protein A